MPGDDLCGCWEVLELRGGTYVSLKFTEQNFPKFPETDNASFREDFITIQRHQESCYTPCNWCIRINWKCTLRNITLKYVCTSPHRFSRPKTAVGVSGKFCEFQGNLVSFREDLGGNLRPSKMGQISESPRDISFSHPPTHLLTRFSRATPDKITGFRESGCRGVP